MRGVNVHSVRDFPVRAIWKDSAIELQFKVGRRIQMRLLVRPSEWPVNQFDQSCFLRVLAGHPRLLCDDSTTERRIDAGRIAVARLLKGA